MRWLRTAIVVPALLGMALAQQPTASDSAAQNGGLAQPLDETQFQAVLRHGLTVHRTMELPVGHVKLRVGVHDLQKDRVGAIELPLLIAARSGTAQLR